jgi:hypothetical protein
MSNYIKTEDGSLVCGYLQVASNSTPVPDLLLAINQLNETIQNLTETVNNLYSHLKNTNQSTEPTKVEGVVINLYSRAFSYNSNEIWWGYSVQENRKSPFIYNSGKITTEEEMIKTQGFLFALYVALENAQLFNSSFQKGLHIVFSEKSGGYNIVKAILDNMPTPLFNQFKDTSLIDDLTKRLKGLSTKFSLSATLTNELPVSLKESWESFYNAAIVAQQKKE